jgi:4-amino-4-deoxy-L-arabinose transferase-like glycosyltransferase
MLVAIAAFHDLIVRRWGRSAAVTASVLFIASPLSIFVGRAVMPESWMLAGMLTSAACYQRFLAGGKKGWLMAAAVAGLGGALFKYYGLLVLAPLADMTARSRGWRGCLGWRFLVLLLAMIVPVGAWMALVFARTQNPLTSGWVPGQRLYPYFVWEVPRVLLDPLLYRAFFRRFLVFDCGPITAILLVVGVAAALKRRVPNEIVGGWTVMSLGFFLAFAPKLIDHDYYEFVMLPCATAWGALGFSVVASWLTTANVPWRRALGAGVLGLALALQSPWFMGSSFALEWGKRIAAVELTRLLPRSGRVVAMGPGTGLRVIVHYSGHEGWPVQTSRLAANWRREFARYQEQGGTHVVLYFGARATAAQRDSYKPLIACCPIVVHNTDAITGAGVGEEFAILDLRAFDFARDREPALFSGGDRHIQID